MFWRKIKVWIYLEPYLTDNLMSKLPLIHFREKDRHLGNQITLLPAARRNCKSLHMSTPS